MLLEDSSLSRDTLTGQVALVTGAGGGIGYEAARALCWLGAKVIVAEIDERNGRQSAEKLIADFGKHTAIFVKVDISSEEDIMRLKQQVIDKFGKVDILLNNATVSPMGPVKDVPIAQWDASYGVNLRGPVLLIRAFLPGMLERDYGVIACVTSSGAGYMGAYECFKSAQAHLATTLDDELSQTNVHAFSIGPGLVPTPGSKAGLAALEPHLGKTAEEIYEMNAAHVLTAEEAGVGFAASIALADSFRGQDVASTQALIAIGLGEKKNSASPKDLDEASFQKALSLLENIRKVFREQSEGWKERNMFERQWMLRDFKKYAKNSIEKVQDDFNQVESDLKNLSMPSDHLLSTLRYLESYYEHMQHLARGYEKNQEKLNEHLGIIDAWRKDLRQLIQILTA